MIQPPCRIVGHTLLVVFCSAPLCSVAATQPSVGLRVVKRGEYVFVRSAFSSHRDLVVRVGKGSNRQINFLNTRLVPVSAGMDAGAINGGTLIHGNGDDATPWNINGTCIGGNHGCSDTRELPCPNHGMTVADLGSEWVDEAGTKFYLVKVADYGYVVFKVGSRPAVETPDS